MGFMKNTAIAGDANINGGSNSKVEEIKLGHQSNDQNEQK